jgi:biopolymer transport protein ExbD
MSHGGGGEGSADPNLTPLLDLVLQLLMFFIMCVNFSSEQVSGDIKLPYSDSAKAIEKADIGSLYLNVKSMRSKEFRDKLAQENKDDPGQIPQKFQNQDAVVLVPGLAPQTMLETRLWLRTQYDDAKKVAVNGEVKTVVNFRPDEEIELNQLFQLMQFCKVAGYKKLKLRAKIRGGT